MANKRMFSQDIVGSDAFLEMPASTQALYFHLGMRADDDGFVTPKVIMRLIGSSEDDLKVLKAKRFILPFESGVVVIKHWLIHNLVRADLYKETLYKREKSLLGLNENGGYTELREGIMEMKKIEAPDWLLRRRGELRTANVPQTALRIGKDRLGEDRGESSLYYLKEIPVYDLEELYSKYDCSRGKIKEKAESLYLYCEAKGKKYKNYKAFLENALKKDFPLKKQVFIQEQKEEELGDRSHLLIKPDFLKRNA